MLRSICLCLILFAVANFTGQAQVDELLNPQAIIQENRDNQFDTLVLISRGMDVLPPEIFSLTWLEALSLGNHSTWIHLDDYTRGRDNTFFEIPPDIAQLQQLRILEIDGGNVSEIPPEIGQLENLESLILKDLKIEELPPEIGNLKNLRSLNLRGNLLRELPQEFAQLTNLESLDIERNLFADIPPELWDLPALQAVGLANNPIPREEIERFDRHLTSPDNNALAVIVGVLLSVVVAIGLIIYRRHLA